MWKAYYRQALDYNCVVFYCSIIKNMYLGETTSAVKEINTIEETGYDKLNILFIYRDELFHSRND